jgi:GxxExxY protein
MYLTSTILMRSKHFSLNRTSSSNDLHLLTQADKPLNEFVEEYLHEDEMEQEETSAAWERGGGRRKVQERIKEQVYKFCHEVAKDLGGGHSETVYEQALLKRLYNARIPCLRQVQWFSKTKTGDLLTVGFADLEIDHFMVIELKIGPRIKVEHITQLNRYLRSAQKMQTPHYCGAVVCFQTTADGQNCNTMIHEVMMEDLEV